MRPRRLLSLPLPITHANPLRPPTGKIETKPLARQNSVSENSFFFDWYLALHLYNPVLFLLVLLVSVVPRFSGRQDCVHHPPPLSTCPPVCRRDRDDGVVAPCPPRHDVCGAAPATTTTTLPQVCLARDERDEVRLPTRHRVRAVGRHHYLHRPSGIGAVCPPQIQVVGQVTRHPAAGAEVVAGWE